ncbi:MAG: undecaprenyl/decaprenyl-phosphate alpha-N-acetylglucosaminyl 1-phosphate transferase [Clostridia bacterium]|nr:undecaprenyl/decaprenyl-phosphate alpha-N-acetylglucosaminyl 1-phosphate transferase [Clostridia bacterium]MBT7121728.1 undecaprenyl/decaprenyl-phosphate alpha-N-acetylglucosaminyl 1-phosphate transferase [Clostridia bacterium]
MLNNLLSIFVPLLLSLFLTPLMIVIAKKRSVLDVPDKRKSHNIPTPLLGGVAILIATVVSISLFATSTSVIVKLVMIGGLSGVALIGLIDDVLTVGAKKRLIVLIVLAIVVYVGSLQIYVVTHVNTLTAEIFFGAFVIIWIVGVTNAVNFSDGIDGLSSYLSLVATIAFAILFALQGRTVFALPIALSLSGAIAGFIPYNRTPAMIFMGDAGSMFIGFILGMLSIMSISKEASILSLVVPLYILLVPITDMCMSILRRILIKKPIMQPDKMHLHHVLNKRFNNHLIVVIILSLIQLAFAGFGIIIFIYKIYLVGAIVLVTIVVIAVLITVVSAIAYRKKHAVKESN